MRSIVVTAIAAVVLLACSGCSTEQQGGPAVVKMTDSELEQMIRLRMDTDSAVRDHQIIVKASADMNEATLSGAVRSEEVREKAVALAKTAREGLTVKDAIEVKPLEISRGDFTEKMARDVREAAKATGSKVGDSLDDAWIHTKVVSKLIASDETPKKDIRVDVVDRIVTLRGTVSSTLVKQEAERVARETGGVRGVKNFLQVRT